MASEYDPSATTNVTVTGSGPKKRRVPTVTTKPGLTTTQKTSPSRTGSLVKGPLSPGTGRQNQISGR